MSWIRRSALAGALVAFLSCGTARADSPVGLCLPSTAGGNVTTPTSGSSCASGGTYKAVAAQTDLDAAKARIATLEDKLQDVTRSTVNGQPTVRFSGVNVQLVNGGGATTSTNGKGNLIVGYNETPRAQTGSHNIVTGRGQGFTSWGGLIGGENNSSQSSSQVLFGIYGRATQPYATVLGGWGNQAYARLSTIAGGCENVTGTATPAKDAYCTDQSIQNTMQSVTGGAYNRATGTAATITGGLSGLASGGRASITGGSDNVAGTRLSSIVGGCENSVGTFRDPSGACETAGVEGNFQSILGGRYGTIGNTATAASISGGEKNRVDGAISSIAGGKSGIVTGVGSGIAGGENAVVMGTSAWVGGGDNNIASGDYGTVLGGRSNEARNTAASVSGGFHNLADAFDSSILGGVDVYLGSAGNSTFQRYYSQAGKVVFDDSTQ